MLKVKRLFEDAQVPVKAHDDDSGWDLFAHRFLRLYTGPAPEQCLVPGADGLIPGAQERPGVLVVNPLERVMIGTGISATVGVGLPLPDCLRVELQVRPRSGNRLKKGLEVHFGTVDVSYRGEICVVLTNLGNEAATLEVGDRVAQLVPAVFAQVPVDVVEDLDSTGRGTSGFGDSGTR